MWTFPGLLFIFYISAFPAAWIVRALAPIFWQNSTTNVHVLIKVTTIPEIDNQIYITFVVLSGLFYVLHFLIVSRMLKRFPRIDELIRSITNAITIYLCIVRLPSVYSLDQIQVLILVQAIILTWLLEKIRWLRFHLLEIIFPIVVLRFGSIPVLTYDIGANKYVSLFDYLYFGIALLTTGYAYLFFRFRIGSFAILRIVSERFSKQRLAWLVALGFIFPLLFLMTKGNDALDMHFTFLSAYQFTKGGVPFVSMMSQYGMLYLAPWILWLFLFPELPITYGTGTIVTTLLLFGYAYLLIRLLYRMYESKVVFVLTAISGMYFPLFIRFWGFPDQASLLSMPAFTPLRFGMFIFPMWFLVGYVQTGYTRYLRLFLAITSIFFFYSFEAGIGMLVAAIALIIFKSLTTRTFYHLLELRYLFGSLLLVAAIISLYTLVVAGELPDFYSYAFFSMMYATGFLMLPMDNQTLSVLFIVTAAAGGIYGSYLVSYRNQSRGYIYFYLMCMTLVLHPYYVGRTVIPVLYSVSLPFLLMCGMFTQDALTAVRNAAGNVFSWVVLFMCGFIIAIGGVRGSLIMGSTLLHSAEIIESSVRYVYTAVTTWDVQRSDQYIFLKKNLPPGCPLMTFDDVFEYVPAIGAIPAFNYPFFRGIITSKEQIDALVPNVGSKQICFFVDQQFINMQDDLSYEVYVYFWKKYGDKSHTLAVDKSSNFTLYSFPTDIFHHH